MTQSTRIAAIAAVVGGVVAAATTASAALTLPTQTCSYTFTANLKKGMKHAQVRDLQKLLNMYPQTTVSITGAGSMGNETDFFGAATMRAVIKFQELNAADVLSPIGAIRGTGNVFSLTRAVLNQVCNGTITTPPTTPPTSGNVNVSLASNQPTSVLVSTQAFARLADFKFTGNGVVTAVKLTRTGVSANTTLSNVYLYDGMTRVAGPASVLSDGSINFNATAGLFTVSGNKTITVRSDIAASTSGQSVGVNLSGFTTAGNAMTMTSVMGTQLPIASVTLSTATLSGAQVSTGTTDAGVMQKTSWTQTLNIGTREARFNGMTLKMIGSAPADALANVSLFIDGVKFGNSVSLTPTYLAEFSAASKLLTTGNHTLEVRADIVKGSSRNYMFSLENASDILVEDRDIAGAYVTVGNSTNNAAGVISINAGNLTISQDPAFMNTQVVGGATNVEIARYVVRAYGEDVKITTLSVLPVLTGATPAANGLNNVSLYVNGGQVGSSVNWTATATPVTFNNLGSSIIVPAGSSVILAVKADMMSTASVNYTAGTVQANLVAGTSNAQGITSNQLVNTSAATGKTLTISSASVVFNTTAGFVAQTLNPNTNNVKLGSFTLQTGGAEGVRVTNLAVIATTTSSGLNNFANLTVKDGSTVISSPVGNIQTTNNFSASIEVPMSGTKTFDVYVDILGAPVATTLGVAMTASTQGLVNTVATTTTSSVLTSNINIASLAAATLKGTSPTTQYVVSGTTGKTQAVYNFVSTNGTANINKILVGLSGTGYTSITVTDGTSSVTKGLTTGATSILVDGLNISVPNSVAGKDVTIIANFATVGNGGVTTNGANTVSINAGGEFTSGNTVAALTASAASSSAQRLVGSLFTKVARTSTGVSVGAGSTNNVKLGSITLTASTAGPVTLKQLPVNLTLPTGGTASNVLLKMNGSTLSNAPSAYGSVASSTFNWTTPYSMSAGDTVVFDVYADIAGVTTSGSGDVALGTPSTFLWDDINSGVAGTLTGTLIFNFGN